MGSGRRKSDFSAVFLSALIGGIAHPPNEKRHAQPTKREKPRIRSLSRSVTPGKRQNHARQGKSKKGDCDPTNRENGGSLAFELESSR